MAAPLPRLNQPEVLTRPVGGSQASDNLGGIGEAYRGLADLSSQITDTTIKAEKPYAEARGAASVARDPETGELKTIDMNPFNGAAYNHGALAAYTAQSDADQDEHFLKISQANPSDAEKFKAGAAGWLKTQVSKAPAAVRADLQIAGQKKISQYVLGIGRKAQDEDTKTHLLTLNSAADRAANRINDLAYSAGTDTPEFQQASRELDTWLLQLKNPIFGAEGQKLADSKADKLSEAQLYAVQGHFERDPRVTTNPESVIADAKGQMYDPDIDATIEQKNARFNALSERVRSDAVKANAAGKDYLNSLPPEDKIPLLTKALKEKTGTPVDVLSPGEKQLGLRSAQNDVRIEADRARFEQERQAVHVRVGLENDYTNAAAMVEHGFPATRIPSDHQIEAAYPFDPEKAALVKEQVADLQTISGFLKGLPTATPEQVAKLRAEVAPDPGNPDTFARRSRISSALNSALTARATAVQADPAGYLLAPTPNSPHSDLQALYTTAVQTPTAPATRIPLSSAGQTMFGAYADHMQSLQTTMGVPEAMQHILPAAVAQSMAISISTDPAQASQKIQQLQGQFGDTWPKVWHDLTTLGKLPSEYQLIGAMDNRQDAELLARAMTEGKGGKNIDDLLPPQTSGAIKRDVLANPQLQQYLFSLDASGASDAQKVGIRDAVVKLAYAKAFYGRDAAAATNAISSVIGAYEFLGGARIPTAMSGSIKTNATATLRGLTAGPSMPATPGMKEPGNLDPWNRPSLQNQDGSYSTTSSISIGTDKGETLIPTVVDGKRLSNAEAIKHFQKTGQHLGVFDTPANADSFATALHNAQASRLDAHGAPLKGIEIAVPDVYGKPGMPAVRDYLDALKATPNWITSPKGDALWLKDSGNRIVLDKKGKPVSVPFNAGTMAPAPVDTPQVTPGL